MYTLPCLPLLSIFFGGNTRPSYDNLGLLSVRNSSTFLGVTKSLVLFWPKPPEGSDVKPWFKPAWPKRTYWDFLLESLRTEYASADSLNFTSACLLSG